jgi:hypothetical protein
MREAYVPFQHITNLFHNSHIQDNHTLIPLKSAHARTHEKTHNMYRKECSKTLFYTSTHGGKKEMLK